MTTDEMQLKKPVTNKSIQPVIVEPAGKDTFFKIYINSVDISAKGTWLVSFTSSEESSDGTLVPLRVLLRRSLDKGTTWQPRVDVYDGKIEGAKQAEMGQLVTVPDTNRIYQFSIRHTGVRFGELVYTYSDDDGITWLGPNGKNTSYKIDVPAYALVPEGNSNHLMAKGIILDTGQFVLPFAISTDPEELAEIQAEVAFMFSDNIFTETDPSKLRFSFYPDGDHGIRVPKADGIGTLAQEPHVVQLSDSRLFCTMRTGRGCIYCSISEDIGRTWSKPQPLRYDDKGSTILHPNAPCPLIKLSNGQYILFHHSNDGTAFGGKDCFSYQVNRRPVYIAIGQEKLDCEAQPLTFTESMLLCDSDGVPSENSMKTTEMSCYGGIIEDDGDLYYIYANKWSWIELIKIPEVLSY